MYIGHNVSDRKAFFCKRQNFRRYQSANGVVSHVACGRRFAGHVAIAEAIGMLGLRPVAVGLLGLWPSDC